MTRGRRGRPSLGYAKDYKIRLRQQPSELVEAACLAAGASYQNYLEAIVEIGLRHRHELPPDLMPKEVLPEAG